MFFPKYKFTLLVKNLYKLSNTEKFNTYSNTIRKQISPLSVAFSEVWFYFTDVVDTFLVGK